MTNEKITLEEKLLNMQSELKAPKNQYNSFGKYNYRSAEDIIEAIKPLEKAHRAVMTISDEVMPFGNRVYIRATVTLTDIDDPSKTISASAYAREPESKKGMDDSQITGTASSYARKYALNGLFAIDDTKDADALNNGSPAAPPKKILCTQCGKEIVPMAGRDGKLRSAEEIVKLNNGLCIDCFKAGKGGNI